MQDKTWCVAAFLFLCIFQSLALTSVSAKNSSYYTAAVFEFVQTQNCTSDPELAKKALKFNADFFSQVATLAKSKGADIIVFPEYGLYPECLRFQTYHFCESIPAEPRERAIPCTDPERFSKSPTLMALSCMARNNSIVLQANMAEYLLCKGEPGCPLGRLQFNTNVVFDRDGSLIARYRKEHLWNEVSFDMPRKKQLPIFTVDFGTFISYVCYDIFLERIIEEIRENVDGIFFSTYWENTMPLGMTVQFFESFALTVNTTLLAACIQAPGQWAVGSGIFNGQQGALAYTFDPDGLNKLVVARVPRRHHILKKPKSSTTVVYFNGTTSDWDSDGKNVQEDGSDIVLHKFSLNHNTDIHYHVINMENYTLHQLTEPTDSFMECNNGMCCYLNYSSDAITESFYLAVFNGSQDTFYPYYFGVEECMLVRCNAANGRDCASFPMWSKDIFHHLSMTGNFSTRFVYPSVVNDHFRLLPYSQWNYTTEKSKHESYHSNINFDSRKGYPLLVAGLNARVYRNDPKISFF